MAFVDEVKIQVISGAGGRGCVSFRREKYVPYGGPNGGNGGRGGDVIMIASHDKRSLLDFTYRPQYRAKRGEHGMGKEMDGRGGEDLLLHVPVGTLVFDAETEELLVDLAHPGDTVTLAKGGRGGRGNRYFMTSTNRAPRKAEPGEEGQARLLRLELRLLADVGLIGLPNAGKSSFLRAVSRAKPKVADYPFTTIHPGLGIVDHKGTAFAVADLPGLIEGASEGHGLGHRFLRHVSRNRILLHLVDISADEATIKKNIRTIKNELKAFDPALARRPQVLVFTKVDLIADDAIESLKKRLTKRGQKTFFISSATHEGIEPLLDYLAELSQEWSSEPAAETAAAPELLH